MTLNISYNFDEEFCDFYNKYHQNPKKMSYLQLIGINRKQLDIADFSKSYFKTEDIQDISIDSNANIGQKKSPSNYFGEVMKSSMKLDGIYILWKYLKSKFGVEESNRLISKFIEGWYYIHDCSGINIQNPYCFAYSCINIIFQGMPYGQLNSLPPKKFSTFIGQVIETTMNMAQDFAGAIAISDFFINCAWFTMREKICDKKIEDEFQRLIHILNNPFRISSNSPFTNISIFDRTLLEKTFENYFFPDGTKGNDKGLIDETIRLQKIYMNFVSKKDPITKTPYRFPINTVSIGIDKNNKVIDNNFLKLFSEYNTEGIFNIYITKDFGKTASCCRLLSDVKEILEIGSKVDSFGNGGINVGSARVVTLNLARIGKIADGDFEKYKEILSEQLDDIKKLLDTHRYLLRKRIKRDYLKFFTLGWVNLDKHLYSTFGINGLYESVKYMGKELSNDNNEGIGLAKKIMKEIRKKVNGFIKEENGKILYNIEQVPAEQVSVLMPKLDSIFFNIPEEEYPFKIYANQFIPLWHTVDLWERAKLDGELCEHFTGGHISHLNIGSSVTPEQMEKLINFAIESKLEHFALNPIFSVCKNNHTNLSNGNVCPVCGEENIEKITRIVGYFVPVSSWNPTRRDWEFGQRKFLKLGRRKNF